MQSQPLKSSEVGKGNAIATISFIPNNQEPMEVFKEYKTLKAKRRIYKMICR